MKTDGRFRFNAVDWVSLVLVIIGALNWGLVGLGELIGTDLNVVNALLGGVPTLEALAYLLVGLAGVYELYFAYQLYSRTTREAGGERAT